MQKSDAADRGRASNSPGDLLAKVDVCPGAFRELLWLSGANLPPGMTVDPAAVDWSKLISLAYEQRMLPVLHAALLKQLAAHEKYAWCVPLLGTAQIENTKRNLALASETLRLLDALETQGVPAIAFKGCLLSAAAYGSIAARKAGDIDLLVRKSDVRRAAEILAGCGYDPFRKRTPAELRGLLALDCEWELINRERHIGLDLHWEFNGKNSGLFMPIQQIWSRQQTMKFFGRKVRCLCREDLIFMLCLHATKHHLQTLEWTYTIAQVVNQSEGIDWEIILQEAESSKATRLLNLGLLMADEIYGLSLPEKVCRQIQSDATGHELAERALKWMLRGANYLPEPKSLRKYYADTRLGWYAKAQYWIHAAITPTAKDYRTNFPPGLDWCYYAIRVVRLLGEKLSHRFGGSSAQAPRHVIQWVPEPKILRAINGHGPAVASNAAAPESS